LLEKLAGYRQAVLRRVLSPAKAGCVIKTGI